MSEHDDRVEILKGGSFSGHYRKGPFEVNYSRREFTAGDESYILRNTELRILEAVIRCYPDPAPWERLEFFVFGDKEIQLPRKNLHVHHCRIRKEMMSSKYELSTVWGEGLMIKERENVETCFRGTNSQPTRLRTG